jgi:antitoxin (DNA-binding transcriptional repressor) of toxin-antitoxin stability system
VTTDEIAERFDEFLALAESGDEVEITRDGVVIARLTGVRSPAALRGRFAGIATSTASDEELFSMGAWRRMTD